MADNENENNGKIQQLSAENTRMRATLADIESAIEPFLDRRKPSQPRTFDQQLLHDVRNILNELGLLRALVSSDEPEKMQ